MKKASVKTKIAAIAMTAIPYFANPDFVYSQRKPIIVKESEQDLGTRNKIQSRSLRYTAAGEGIFLKNTVFDIMLKPGEKVSLDQMFGLYAERGGKITYDAGFARREMTKRLSLLKQKSILTHEENASISYIEKLLRTTKESDKASVSLLEKALGDEVIDPEADQLFENNQWRIKDGRYILTAKSPLIEQYKGQSIPIIVDVKTSLVTEPESVVEQPKVETQRVDSLVLVEDSLTKVRQYRLDLEKAKEDSLIEERKRIAAQEIDKVDSITKKEKKEIADSAARIPRINYGFEASAGTNQELVVGTFMDYPLNKRVSLEAFGNFYFAKGKSISKSSDTTVTFREKQLIGPGLYKQRTDEIIGTNRERAVADFGVGLLYKPTKDFEFPLKVGVNFAKEEGTLYGKSTIVHERNMQPLGDPQVITNSMEGSKRNTTNFAFGVGGYYNIRKNLSSGISFNRTGKNNSARINLKYKF